MFCGGDFLVYFIIRYMIYIYIYVIFFERVNCKTNIRISSLFSFSSFLLILTLFVKLLSHNCIIILCTKNARFLLLFHTRMLYNLIHIFVRYFNGKKKKIQHIVNINNFRLVHRWNDYFHFAVFMKKKKRNES